MQAHKFSGNIVIANRASGTVSIINPRHNATVLVKTVDLPGTEPMYFAYSHQKSELWVGDRANSRLQILKMAGGKVERDGSISTPEGIFHTFFTQDPREPYPLVFTACDIANVTVVHDLTTRREVAIIPLPPVVAALGGIPHDVTANRDYAFVTYIKNSDGAGYVASYNTKTFEMVNVLKTANDPHVAIRDDTALFVAAQGGELLLVSVPDLNEMKRDVQMSPHGAIISFNSRHLYITNIADGGDNALVVYDAATLEKLPCDEIKTTNAGPHNPTVTLSGLKIFTTHSSANSMSVFDIDRRGCPIQSSEMVFETGMNPFGILTLPRAARQPICKTRRCPVSASY